MVSFVGKEMNIRLEAAKWLEENEWCQGAYVNGKGARCLVGALGVFTEDAKLLSQVIRELDSELGIPPFDATDTITKWNDEPSRTKEEVIAALRNNQ